MKKALSIIVCLILIFGLVGCAPKAIRNTQKSIEDIGEVTVKSIEQIQTANSLYEALTDEEKTQVENCDILEKANKRLAEILYMWFFYPKVRYNALAKMKQTQNEYNFTDEKIFVTTTGAEYNGEAEIEYSLFVKVYETTKYLFLYQTNNQVFIVDKSTIEGGTVEKIRNKLSSFVKDKYIICKY